MACDTRAHVLIALTLWRGINLDFRTRHRPATRLKLDILIKLDLRVRLREASSPECLACEQDSAGIPRAD
jgi:hypothetical protein